MAVTTVSGIMGGTAFQTSDGNQFSSQSAATSHEASLQSAVSSRITAPSSSSTGTSSSANTTGSSGGSVQDLVGADLGSLLNAKLGTTPAAPVTIGTTADYFGNTGGKNADAAGTAGVSQVAPVAAPVATPPQTTNLPSGITYDSSAGDYSWTAPNGTLYGFASLQDAEKYVASWGSGTTPGFTTQPVATTTPTTTTTTAPSTTPPIPVTVSPTISAATPTTPTAPTVALPSGMGQSASGFTYQGGASAAMPDINTLMNTYQQVFGNVPPGLQQYLQSGDVQQALQGNTPMYMQNDAQWQQFLHQAVQNRLAQNQTQNQGSQTQSS